MAKSLSELFDSASDALYREIESDSLEWREGDRSQKRIPPKELLELQMKLDSLRAKAAGRRIFFPVTRVDV